MGGGGSASSLSYFHLAFFFPAPELDPPPGSLSEALISELILFCGVMPDPNLLPEKTHVADSTTGVLLLVKVLCRNVQCLR